MKNYTNISNFAAFNVNTFEWSTLEHFSMLFTNIAVKY